jgi:hypothetical protein
MRLIWHIPKASYMTFTLSSFLGIALLLVCSLGCAPTSSTGNNLQNQSSSASNDLPEITDEEIREKINDAYVREVPEDNGAGEPISWRFGVNEPKEFTVVEKQSEGGRATIILDIKTSSSPSARTPRRLAGQIRTKWELQTGWALRTWEIVETENISLKYKNLPKPTAQNSNH